MNATTSRPETITCTLCGRSSSGASYNEIKAGWLEGHNARFHWTPEVGMFVQYTMVTDTVVVEITKVSPSGKSIEIRRTARGEKVQSENRDGNPYPVVWTAAVSDPTAQAKTVRLTKQGTFRANDYSTLVPANMIDGTPVTYTDYRM